MGGGGGGGWSFPSESPGSSGTPKKSPPTDKPDTEPGDGLPLGGGGSGGGVPPGDPCDIQDIGTLRSPVQAVVSTLSEGDWLDVVEEQVNGVSVLVAKQNGATAGVVDCPREQDILDCIDNGNVYQARVDRIRGGAISVTVIRVGP